MRKALTYAALLATICGVQVWAVGHLKQDRAEIDQKLIAPYQKQIDELTKSLQESQAQNEELRKRITEVEDERNQKQDEIEQKTEELKAVEASAVHGFQVTWYNTGTTTKSGTKVEDGLTVSVDPAVIPLGSWVKIVLPDGTTMKRRADDTGGAVKGRILDVYSSAPTSELMEKGRVHGATVYILKG